jgi:hypothetical protein
MTTVRCHTVPKFYLNYFLPPGSDLFWVYDKKDDASRKQPPVNTTVIVDYYLSPPDEKGEKDKRAEEFLSVIEGWGKDALDKIIADPLHWDEGDKEVIAMFLAFTHCRSPRSVEAVKEINKASGEYLLDKIKEQSKDPTELRHMYDRIYKSDKRVDGMSFEDFAKMVSTMEEHVYIEPDEKHAIGDSLLTTGKVHSKLMEMHWRVCAIKKDHFFITSDAPVNIFLPMSKNEVIFGGGLGVPNVQVAFPITPKLCLFLSYEPCRKFEYVYADFVDSINKRAVYMAERFVISPHNSNKIRKIISGLCGSYKTPKIDADTIKKFLASKGVDLPKSKS